MAHIVSKQRNNWNSNCSLGIETAQDNIGLKVEAVGHESHGDTNADDTIEIDEFATFAVWEIAEDWGNEDLH